MCLLITVLIEFYTDLFINYPPKLCTTLSVLTVFMIVIVSCLIELVSGSVSLCRCLTDVCFISKDKMVRVRRAGVNSMRQINVSIVKIV
ncbi:Uncharacterised protein [BD1-7 clade bacterium]|uniref:Uncharacterized protein n=1 Tax=BD1-7 clade bacterium TaxID=2029982 RepID=A0A5S9QUS2_9GAMM|nr:Uncharacterised protein [BD1-7 clade bacterium]